MMRVLFLTHRLPYAPNRGDRIRAFHIAETLRRDADLEIISLVHSAEEMAEIDGMRARGLTVAGCAVPRVANLVRGAVGLAGRRPLTHALLHSPEFERVVRRSIATRPPDVVLAFCSGMARFAVEEPLARYPLVIDLVDVDSAKWSELSRRSTWPKRWLFDREAHCLADFERTSAGVASSTLVVNEKEAASLRAIAPGARIHVVENGIDVSSFRPAAGTREGDTVIFCGVMNYAPNVDAVLWFAREVWPLVRARHPAARFVIVGADPSPAVSALRSDAQGISVTGTVPDVQSYLWSSAVSVAPLRMARGIQNKVLEALAAELPVVLTPQVAEGLPAQVLSACAVANTPHDFAHGVSQMLALSAGQRRDLARRADFSALSWPVRLAPMLGALKDAAG